MASPATTRAMPRDALAECPRVPNEREIEPPADSRGTELAAWITSVLDRFEGPLLGYAQRITGDVELAGEVLPETLLRACREDRAALDGHLAQWLFRVCRSRALDVQRKEQRMSLVMDLDLQAAPSGNGPPELLAARETKSRLLGLLEGLPANQQEVIRLKFQNDLSYREIADVTGHSVSNVGFLLHTGLKRLRELMKDD